MGAGHGESSDVARAAFVGRERELGELRAALDAAGDGRGRIFLIAGEPGIGKTTLADRVTDLARESNARIAWGRCWEGGGAPAYWPWVQVLRSVIRDPAAGGHSIGAGLGQLLPELRGEDTVATSMSPDEARFELFDAVARALRAASEDSPLLVVLDDVHAADIPSLLLLRFVARGSRSMRMLLVATYRETDARADAQISSLLSEIATDATTVPLRGLREEDVSAYIERSAGRAPAGDLVRAVHTATDGNPFFLDGVVRLLAAEGRLDPGRAPERLSIPEGVRGAILRRLGRVPDESAAVLQVASIAGRDFDADIVARVSGRTRDDVIDLLEEPVRQGLARETLRALGRYTFSHALIRDTLYDSFPAKERARLHLAYADAIEDLHPGAVDESLAELAHHCFAGAAAGGVERAIDYSERAGEQAISTLAYEDAVAHLSRAIQALEQLDRDDARRADLTLRLADAYARSGVPARARAECIRAIDLARRAKDPHLQARATLALGEIDLGGLWVRPWLPDPDWIALLEEALAAIGEESTTARARLMSHLGAALYFTEDRDRGAEMTARAIDVANETGDEMTIALAMTARHLAAWTPENQPERADLVRRILASAERAGEIVMLMQALMWSWTDALETGDLHGARRFIERYGEISEETRRPQFLMYSLMTDATLALLDGRCADAERLNRESRAIAERIGDEGAVVSSWVQAISILRESGRVHELVDIVRFYSRTYAQATSWLSQPLMLTAFCGALDDARRELPRIYELMRQNRRDIFWLPNVAQLAEVCFLVGAPEVSRELHDAAVHLRDRYLIGGRNGVIPTGPVAHFLGQLATDAGDIDTAIGHFAASREMARAMHARVNEARTLLCWADALLRRGTVDDRAAARGILDDAAAIAARCDLPVIAERAAELSARAGATGSGTSAAVTTHGSAGARALTREGDVWSIEHDGETFRIADRLGLRYIARLLDAPRAEIHVLDLLTAAGSGGAEREAGLTAGRPDAGIEILDDEAKKSYRRRLGQLREEAEDARAAGDEPRAERAEDEIDALTKELSAAVGLGGRARTTGSGAERARISVTKAIKGAIEKISEHSPSFAAHLSICIRTGTYCSYSPDRAG